MIDMTNKKALNRDIAGICWDVMFRSQNRWTWSLEGIEKTKTYGDTFWQSKSPLNTNPGVSNIKSTVTYSGEFPAMFD